MPVKRDHILSRGDFDEAVVRLSLNVSDISKEVGIPRTYLTEFRNGDRNLRPELQAKLRDYFEARGVEFEEKPASEGNDVSALSPHPRLNAFQRVRCFFPIADDVSDAVVVKAMDAMEEADTRLAVLLKSKAERDESFLGSGEYTNEAEEVIREAIMLLAQNYLIFRMLRGWRVFNVEPMKDGDVRAVRDVLFETFRDQLSAAGVLKADATSESEHGESDLDESQEEAA